MDEPTTAAPPTPANERRNDIKAILTLVLIALVLRLWQLTHTEVISRDTIHFIRFAWRLDHEPTATVLRTSEQHPAYPVAVWVISHAVRLFAWGDLATTMQISAQLTSALASLLLIVPLFLLGRELFDRRVCFWAVLLFQCLPATGRLMADGLSEPLALLFIATSLLSASRGLRTGKALWFCVAGLTGALAYLTRPEGVLPVAVSGLVLTVIWLRGNWRLTWREYLRTGLSLALPALVLALPYMTIIGGFSVKPTANRITEGAQSLSHLPDLAVDALPLAAWMPGWKDGVPGTWSWASQTLGLMLVRGFFYVFWVPALLGLICSWPRWSRQPTAWLLVVSMAVLSVVLLKVAARVAYLSDRHTVLIIMLGLFWAVDWMFTFAAVVARRPLPAWAVTAVCAALCLIPLVKTLETLHGDRTGFREAGRWLAQHARPQDEIVDPFCWADYYAGRAFQLDVKESKKSTTTYVVVDEGASVHTHLPAVAAAAKLAEKGHVVKDWHVRRGQVKVYEVSNGN